MIYLKQFSFFNFLGKGDDPYLANSRIIHIPIIDKLARATPVMFLPKIPRKWAKEIAHCHSNPVVWYASHFVYYNTRPNVHLQEHVQTQQLRYNMSCKHFGIHVRRSDKVTEARYHDLWEYMEFVQTVRNKLNNTKHHVDNHVYLGLLPSTYTLLTLLLHL